MANIITSISPVDGSIVAKRKIASKKEIAAAFSAARDAQKIWAHLSIAERAKYCSAAVDAMLSMQDAIIPELAMSMGRPVRYGAGELRGFEERARHMIAIAETALANVVPVAKVGFERFVARVPLGVVFTIAPWNYPYLTAVNSVIPALMASNAVVLKHASHTLLVGDRFAKAFEKAGLPKGLFHNLVMSHEQAAEVISGRLANMVCFTGSVPGGKAIERTAAGHFLAVGLELGGKDPAYVRADANLAHAVENLVDGAFFNSGQSCCGIERIYVHKNLYKGFVEGAVELTKKYVLGSPLDQATTLGPMIKADAAIFVRKQIASAIRSGARALIDEKLFAASKKGTPYLGPQILTGVDHQMSVMRDESFGPVVGIMQVSSDEEAIQLMNDSEFGLTAAIWTMDVAAAKSIGDKVETGTVFMNRCDYLDPALTWTGVKDTGRGATLSSIGYESLTRPKSFHLRTTL
ncbi:MAG: aldehyde dehydrogenase family protein [Aestuariivirga sp.]